MGLKMRQLSVRGLMGLGVSLVLGLGSAQAQVPAQRDAEVTHWLAQWAVHHAQPVCAKGGGVACAAPRAHDCGESCAHSKEQCGAVRGAGLLAWAGPGFEARLQALNKAPAKGALKQALVEATPHILKTLQAKFGAQLWGYLKARGYDKASAAHYAATRMQEAATLLSSAAALAAVPQLEARLAALEGAGLREAKALNSRSACERPAVPVHVVKILGPHDKYFAAERDGRLNANRTKPDAWEHFEVIEHADGRVSLKSFHGRYVVAEKNGQANANRREVSDWEKFEWTHHPDGTTSFRGFHGKYLVAEPAGQAKADRAKLDAWEKFRLIPAGQ